jgi:acetylornithine aminotransferase
VALAVLATVEAEGLVGHAAEVGDLLHSTLEDLGQKHVRGIGLMQALVFEDAKAKAFQNACLENGLIVNAVDDNTVRCVPPLIITAEQVEQAGEVMRKALV